MLHHCTIDNRWNKNNVWLTCLLAQVQATPPSCFLSHVSHTAVTNTHTYIWWWWWHLWSFAEDDYKSQFYEWLCWTLQTVDRIALTFKTTQHKKPWSSNSPRVLIDLPHEGSESHSLLGSGLFLFIKVIVHYRQDKWTFGRAYLLPFKHLKNPEYFWFFLFFLITVFLYEYFWIFKINIEGSSFGTAGVQCVRLKFHVIQVEAD